MSNYPIINELLEFVQPRVAILELLSDPRKYSASTTQFKNCISFGQFCMRENDCGSRKVIIIIIIVILDALLRYLFVFYFMSFFY